MYRHNGTKQTGNPSYQIFVRSVSTLLKASEVISSYDGQLKINEPQIFEQALEVLAFRKNIEAQVDELTMPSTKEDTDLFANFYRSTSLFIVL